MHTLIITVTHIKQVHAIQDVLQDAEEDGQLDFAFNVELKQGKEEPEQTYKEQHARCEDAPCCGCC